MPDTQTRWIARLTAAPGSSLEHLLGLSLGLDVWERHNDTLVAVASEAQLAELERRQIARVERLSTVKDFLAWAESSANP